MVLMSTQPPWHFSKKKHSLFPSINHKQSVNTQPTHPPCLCLAGWLSAAKRPGHDWPRLSCKGKRQFHWAKSLSLWPSPPPQGIKHHKGHKGLPAPNNSVLAWHLDGSPPGFSSTTKASLPVIASRKAKKFAPNTTLFSKIQTYWPWMPGKSLQLAPATSKCSLWLVWGYSS